MNRASSLNELVSPQNQLVSSLNELVSSLCSQVQREQQIDLMRCVLYKLLSVHLTLDKYSLWGKIPHSSSLIVLTTFTKVTIP